MNRRTIWILALLIGCSFAGLLYIQTRYMVNMVQMNKEQFASAVNRSLDQASRNMERRETFHYLRQMAQERGYQIDSLPSIESIANGSLFRKHVNHDTMPQLLPDTTITLPTPIVIRKIVQSNLMRGGLMGDRTMLDDAAKAFQQYVRSAFLYQKEVLDEVVFTVLYSASSRRFEDRVDFHQLDAEIARALQNNGVKMHYHLIVNTADGREIYRCPDYESSSGNATFQSVLFRNDPVDKMGTMVINFPDYRDVTIQAAGLMIPAIAFTVLLFATFVVAVWLVFRQKQVAEMRNDFVHNMTHEFKTPLSSISLAAQMLSDPSVPKSDNLLSRLANTISSESRRLRMQVDKVLQMSLIDNHNLNLKWTDLDVNDTVENVVKIFSLKVQQNGGEIVTKLEAERSSVYADEMHFTNVIYNLLDNAVKYRREEVPLHLEIYTFNPTARKVCISITDNGVGIRRDALKRIFDRFYRVSTGDKHDVKGFGLGLAYVKAIVDAHRGSIHCDSVLGQGTTFSITLPLTEVESKE